MSYLLAAVANVDDDNDGDDDERHTD